MKTSNFVKLLKYYGQTFSLLVVICLLFNSYAISCNSDQYEPNHDFSNAHYLGNEDAYLVENICITPDDIDFFRFQIDGDNYWIMVKGYLPNTVGTYSLSYQKIGNELHIETLSYNGSNTNTYLKLFNSNMNLIDFDGNDENESFSEILYSLPMTPYLAVAPQNHIVSSNAGNVSFSIFSNLSWEVVENETWFAISPASGVGNGTFEVIFDENPSQLLRTATISIIVDGTTEFVSITQNGNVVINCTSDIYEPNNTIDEASYIGNENWHYVQNLCLVGGDSDFYSFEIDNELYSIQVRGFGANFEGEYNLSYIRVGNVITFETHSNNGSNVNTYMNLYNSTGSNLAIDNDGGEHSFSQIEYELPSTPFLSATPVNQLVSFEEGIVNFEIESNIDWSVYSSADWLTFNTVIGSNNGTLDINYEHNPYSYSRTATIIISGNGLFEIVEITQDEFTPLDCPGDIYEPNNAYEIATDIGNGNSYELTNLCLTVDDLDYFKFNIDGNNYTLKVKSYQNLSTGEYQLSIYKIGTNLTIETHPLNGSQTDTYMFLYNDQGDLIAKNDNDGIDFFSQINWELPVIPPVLIVTPSQINVSPIAGNTFFNITSNVPWQIVEGVNWLSISQTSGLNNQTIQVNYNNNLSNFDRSGEIQVSGGGLNFTITVNQEGLFTNICTGDPYENNNNLENAYFVTSQPSYLLENICITPGDRDFFKFNIEGADYYIRVKGFSLLTFGEYKLSFQRTGNTITFETLTNNGAETDTDMALYNANGSLLLSNDDFGNSLFSKITYNFPTPSILTVSPLNQTVSNEAGETYFEITSNTEWSATTDANWLVLSPSFGNNDGIIYVDYDANFIPSSRTAIITVNSGDITKEVTITQLAPSNNGECAGDVYEPNNYFTNSTYIGSNANYELIDLCLTIDDNDYFQFVHNSETFHVMVRGFTPIITGAYGLTWNRIGNTVTIETLANNGSAIDTEIFLFDANGSILASNDDGAENGLSKIVYNLGFMETPNQSRIINQDITADRIKSKLKETESLVSQQHIVEFERIFPNPIQTDFTVEYNLKENATVNIKLYNTNGVHVDLNFTKHQLAGPQSQKFNVNSNLPAGNYLLEILTSEGYHHIEQLLLIRA